MIVADRLVDKIFYQTKHGTLYHGDALEILELLPDNYVDTVITDPPYGLSEHTEKTIRTVLFEWLNGNDFFIPNTKGFMNHGWDAFVPPPALWKQVYRVMKPGATLFTFAGQRTQDLMTISLRLAGFIIKDVIMWIYGQGFPKGIHIDQLMRKRGLSKIEIEKWQGYKTHSLKPAYEPIIMAIKPNDGSYIENLKKWGIAGLNIAEARIGTEMVRTYGKKQGTGNVYNWKSFITKSEYKEQYRQGRHPSNVILSHSEGCTEEECIEGCPIGIIRQQSKYQKTVPRLQADGKKLDTNDMGWGFKRVEHYIQDEGFADRFFYIAKVSPQERQNCKHPTMKPIKLIEHLVKLTKMPNPDQIYLDPFFGSGTTAIAVQQEQRRWIGIEIKEEYCLYAKERIEKIFSKNGITE